MLQILCCLWPNLTYIKHCLWRLYNLECSAENELHVDMLTGANVLVLMDYRSYTDRVRTSVYLNQWPCMTAILVSKTYPSISSSII